MEKTQQSRSGSRSRGPSARGFRSRPSTEGNRNPYRFTSNSSSSYRSKQTESFGSSRGGSPSRFSRGGSSSGGFFHGSRRSSGGRSRGGFSRRGNSFGGNDVSRFINKTVETVQEQPTKIVHTFKDFGFVPELQANVDKRGFTAPSPVQDQAIKPIMEGNDLVGLANTGSGKTAAFLLPMINKISQNRNQKLLIIAPTRELAIQIDTEFRLYTEGMRLYSTVCVGGMPIYPQISNLRRNPHVVIGTPGRLKDLETRKCISFNVFQNVVIDEVDHMLDMGFIDDIKAILSKLPEEKQSLFFSATMPPRIRELVSRFVKTPVTVEIKTNQSTKNIEQDIIKVADKSKKFEALHKLLSEPDVEKVLIFSETKRDVEKLCQDLITKGFKAESIHGDKRQRERQRALTSFREDHVTILVATDVAARGLDIKDVTHVINYTVPQTQEDYIHRIGRTGRGNNKGKAYTFV